MFDRYLHIWGTTVFTLFPYNILILLVHPYMYPKIMTAVFVFAFGIDVGALFDIFEFSGDQSMHEAAKMQKGLKVAQVAFPVHRKYNRESYEIQKDFFKVMDFFLFPQAAQKAAKLYGR